MASAEKHPWFKFYPSDWRGSTRLKMSSATARAVLVEMMCIMHDSVPYGYLCVAGAPVSDADLARQSGLSVKVVKAGRTELLKLGVIEEDVRGFVFSPRMVNDELLRRKRAAGGRLSIDHPNTPKPKEKDTVKGYPSFTDEGYTQIPDTRCQIPDKDTTADAAVDSMDVENFVDLAMRTANNGMIAAGIGDFNPILGSHGSRQSVFDWLEAGVPRDVILRTVHQKAKSANAQISSMKYFDKAVRKALEKKKSEIHPDSPAGKILAGGNELPKDTSRPRTDDIAKKLAEREADAIGRWKMEHPDELADLRAKAEQTVAQNPAFKMLGVRTRQRNVDGLVDRWVKERAS